MAPVIGKQKDSSNAGAVKLHWHSENAADPTAQQPHTVALVCLREDRHKEAETRFADVFSVVAALDGELTTIMLYGHAAVMWSG